MRPSRQCQVMVWHCITVPLGNAASPAMPSASMASHNWPSRQCHVIQSASSAMPCNTVGILGNAMWYIVGLLGNAMWYSRPARECHCPACRTTLVATRFRVAVICPIIEVPHCIRVFFYFVWFVFINHIFQFYNELCTCCNILHIYLS